MIPQEILERFEQWYKVKISFEGENTKVYLPSGPIDVSPIASFLGEYDIDNHIWWIGPSHPSSPLYLREKQDE